MHKFVSQTRFHELARRGDAEGTGVSHLASVVRAPDDGSRTRRFCLSDGSVDRMKDKINPHGWVTADYMRNPVVLWSHNAQEPPVGRMVRIFVSGDRLMGDVQFPADGVYEFADQIYRLITSGYINAGSVGFIPLEWKFADSKDRQMGVDFLKQELIEFSICPVPANANALIEARSWGGRKADPEFRELIGQLGRLIRAAQLRKELPPPLYTRAECREIVEALRREV